MLPIAHHAVDSVVRLAHQILLAHPGGVHTCNSTNNSKRALQRRHAHRQRSDGAGARDASQGTMHAQARFMLHDRRGDDECSDAFSLAHGLCKGYG